MRAMFKYALGIIVFLAMCYFSLWGTLAIWFKLPVSESAKIAVIVVYLSVTLVIAVAFVLSGRKRGLVIYSVIMLGLFAWWDTIHPPSEADWAADVSRQVTGEINGDLLTLTDVREFQWRGTDDFSERWTERTYDLSKLETGDYFLSYWGDPKIAHFIMSFGFSDGTFLAWSVEVRRTKEGKFSPVADLFKSNALAIIAAEESDVVGVRSNYRGEDVHIFRPRTEKDSLRAMLLQYVGDANALAEKPKWYNSLTTNCTTVVLRMLMAMDHKVSLNWRLIANGFLPEYSYDKGTLNTSFTVRELRDLGLITERAKKVGLGPGFSAAIREGVPSSF